LGVVESDSRGGLLALADKIKAYIESHAELDNELREKKRLYAHLKTSLSALVRRI
jgi:hypothetical protein